MPATHAIGPAPLNERGLYDIFCAEFGAPGSAAFEAARHNFIVSEAAYAIASFLLQVGGRCMRLGASCAALEAAGGGVESLREPPQHPKSRR